MSERIAASVATLGEGMQIRRALPTARRRLVGAWCFLDHFGPADVAHTRGMRVGPHPHIGLQTVTWLIRGEVLHRDSLGNVQRIEPGALNVMTAGHGISHSEESPEPHSSQIHGLQFWIALPEHARRIEPSFVHHPQVPVIRRPGLRASVLIGELYGERSPALVHSPLVGACLDLDAATEVRIPLRGEFEHGVVVTHGEIVVDGQPLAPGTLLYLEPGREALDVRSGAADAGFTLIGGAPLDEPVLMWWNFVAREKQELTSAVRDWNHGADYFGDVRGYDGAKLVAPMPPWSAV